MTIQDIKKNRLRCYAALAAPIVVGIVSIDGVPSWVGFMLSGVLGVIGGGMVKAADVKSKDVPRL